MKLIVRSILFLCWATIGFIARNFISDAFLFWYPHWAIYVFAPILFGVVILILNYRGNRLWIATISGVVILTAAVIFEDQISFYSHYWRSKITLHSNRLSGFTSEYVPPDSIFEVQTPLSGMTNFAALNYGGGLSDENVTVIMFEQEDSFVVEYAERYFQSERNITHVVSIKSNEYNEVIAELERTDVFDLRSNLYHQVFDASTCNVFVKIQNRSNKFSVYAPHYLKSKYYKVIEVFFKYIIERYNLGSNIGNAK